jgi:predicted transcriptional regulator YdeE
MTPRMTTCDPFVVLGVTSRVRHGCESPELFGGIWKTFESRRQEVESVATEKVYFGVSFPAAEEGVTEYLAGMKVAPGTPWPEGLEARTVSGGRYAVFECPVDAIGTTYQHVFKEWLPSAAVRFDGGRAPFERYPESAAPQPVSLYIPIR